ncbi:MAG: hypothetical protein AB1552_14065 [Nitrospirota bacterium]
MPRRPTKEFWTHVYPKISRKGSAVNPRAVAGGLWQKLSPKIRRLYEEARIAREKEGMKSARYRRAMSALRKFWRES